MPAGRLKKASKTTKQAKPKKPKSPPINRSPAAFEQAFEKRLGAAPAVYIQRKIEAGSSVRDTRYVYELMAHNIASDNHCAVQSFDRYYDPKTMKRREAIPVAEQKRKAAKGNAQPAEQTFRRKRVNKLVRDRIPELMEARGKSCTTEVLSQEEYLTMLETKLDEELAAYHKSRSLEELADLLEVMGAVVKARGNTWEELTKIRKERAEKYGDFSGRTLLWEVVE